MAVCNLSMALHRSESLQEFLRFVDQLIGFAWIFGGRLVLGLLCLVPILFKTVYVIFQLIAASNEHGRFGLPFLRFPGQAPAVSNVVPSFRSSVLSNANVPMGQSSLPIYWGTETHIDVPAKEWSLAMASRMVVMPTGPLYSPQSHSLLQSISSHTPMGRGLV